MFEINSRSAAIDNDFINHLAETRIEDDKLVCILGKLFSAVEMEAIMHPLVYDNELPKNNQRVMRLFQDEVVHRVDFSDITGDIDAKKQYYAFLVKTSISSCWAKSFLKVTREFHTIGKQEVVSERFTHAQCVCYADA